MIRIENLLNDKTPRPRHGLFFIKSENINSTILSLIFSINIIKKSSDTSKKILIADTSGTHSKSNKRIAFLNNDLLPVMNQIISLDKYTFSNIVFNKEYWIELDKKYPNTNTIVITDISVIIIDKNKNHTEVEKKKIYKEKLTEMRLFAEQKNKYIIILETKISNYLYISPYIFKENLYDFYCSKNEMYLQDFQKNSFYLELEKWENNSTSGEDTKALNIKEKISNVARINFDNITKSTLRSLPICKTGFESLDMELEGGFELGQVVSLVSSDNDILTQFSLQMATQLSSFYNPLYICLSMNLRRLKDMLSHKNNMQYNTSHYNNNQETIHLITNDKFTIDGDIEEIIESIKYFHENEDTKVIFIDSDDMLQIADKDFADPKKEVDEIYKRLLFLANKLDIIIILQSELTFEMMKKLQSDDSKNPITIDNSVKAIKYTKTQILIEEHTIKVMKSMKKIGSAKDYAPLIGTAKNKELGNFIDISVE